MWFVVQTPIGKEKEAKDFLLEHVKGVKEVYITPSRKTHYDNQYGRRVETVAPLMSGYIFANIKWTGEGHAESHSPKNAKGEQLLIIRQMEKYLDKGGYFRYQVKVRDLATGEYSTSLHTSLLCHLLSSDPAHDTLGQIIRQAKISDATMEAFRVFQEQSISTSALLRVETERYADMVKEHDVVQIIRGPFTGKQGVIKRCEDKATKNKDRRFFIALGNDLTISISGIHQNDVMIVHEATTGKSSEQVSLWRDIDTVIGDLQFHGHADDAPKTLRRLIRDYNREPSTKRVGHGNDSRRLKQARLEDHAERLSKQEVLSRIRPSARDPFRALCEYFQKEANSSESVLAEYIPDAPVRPFLTPAWRQTETDEKGYTLLEHKNFKEYIVRKDLSSYFLPSGIGIMHPSPFIQEDFQYFAHVVVVKDRRKVKVIAPCGGFYEQYAILSPLEIVALNETLEKRQYPKFLQLLQEARVEDSLLRFEQVKGIGGFSLEIGDDEYATVQRLIEIVAPAMVEIWQGTRLQQWRQLLQRYVLLHKVPIADMPSVIIPNDTIDRIFQEKDENGYPDLRKITSLLSGIEELFRDHLQKDHPDEAVTLFLQACQGLSTHYVKDEHYNFIPSEGYLPDKLCSKMFAALQAQPLPDSVQDYLRRGIEELQASNSWKYFHLPSCLRDTVALR